MTKSLIGANPTYKRDARADGSPILHISENFYDTIQGEGVTAGVPAAFLRTQYCTLNCKWCDTLGIWKTGNPYSTKEIVDMWDESGLTERFREGQHLVLTGGSPLKQQEGLVDLLRQFEESNGFLPFIEVENECTLIPGKAIEHYVNQWNNSPKLSNSGMRQRVRLKPEVLKHMSSLENSYFKYVITNEEDWDEIDQDFINPGLIRSDQVILMPEGSTRNQLQGRYELVSNLAAENNVRMSDRMHIMSGRK